MKTSCHVLSGAYDAAVLVFTLARAGSSKEMYLGDYRPGHTHTKQLLELLSSAGLRIAFVPPVG